MKTCDTSRLWTSTSSTRLITRIVPQISVAAQAAEQHCGKTLAQRTRLRGLVVMAAATTEAPVKPRKQHDWGAVYRETPTPYIQDKMNILSEDLKHLFDDKGIDPTLYDDKVDFVDPITKYSNARGYAFNIKFLKVVFSPTYILHDMRQTGEYEITTRWTMQLTPFLAGLGPLQRWWDPTMTFTGVSIMGVNPETGKFNRHVDYWDNIERQDYFSLEAFLHVLGQLANTSRAPDIPTPEFTILKKLKDYEVRRYKPFLVAETDMEGMAESSSASNDAPSTSGRGTSAFNALAGYIFGGNQRKERMSMTTPVFSSSRNRMQFVVDPKFKDLSSLPAPESSRVQTREVPGGDFAVMRFGGNADEATAAQKEAALRRAILADGLKPASDTWTLARYNDPSTPGIFRRNEVLIEVQDFLLW